MEGVAQQRVSQVGQGGADLVQEAGAQAHLQQHGGGGNRDFNRHWTAEEGSWPCLPRAEVRRPGRIQRWLQAYVGSRLAGWMVFGHFRRAGWNRSLRVGPYAGLDVPTQRAAPPLP